MRTDESGEFRFPAVPIGHRELRIRAIGYVQKSQEILVSVTGWEGTIVLDRLPQPLPNVQVRAPWKPPEFDYTTKYDDFFRRQRIGQGTFRTRADIERLGATNVASVLQGIPGVTASWAVNMYGEAEMHFRIARCPGQPPNLAVYINGIKQPAFSNRGSELSGITNQSARGVKSSCPDCARLAETLESVPFGDIILVEFYRGPGQIPSDLDRGDACAAIGIWTR